MAFDDDLTFGPALPEHILNLAHRILRKLLEGRLVSSPFDDARGQGYEIRGKANQLAARHKDTATTLSAPLLDSPP